MRVMVRSLGAVLVAVLVSVALVVSGALAAPSGAAVTRSATTGTTGGSGADGAESPSATPAAVPGGTSTGDGAGDAGSTATDGPPRALAAAAATTTTTTTTTPASPTTTNPVPTPTTPVPPPVPDPLKWRMTSSAQTYGGASFNNQYGSVSSQRRNLNRVIAAINGTPGYVVPNYGTTKAPYKGPGFDARGCPTNPALFPSRIRISVYSVADGAFANALVRAHRRCVSVQILMNNHLTESTSRSWGTIARNLNIRGKVNRSGRSFAYRCQFGCRGVGVLHSKFYLFDSRAGRPDHTVLVGSSNMTSNAVKVQANDLYGVNGNTELFDSFTRTFTDMALQHRATVPRTFGSGKYTGYFYPYRAASSSTDLTARALRSISCTGATGGAGINGRSVIYINMHAWHGTRGRWLAQRVKSMYNQGCYVRILYSFMGKGTYAYLKKGTGSRMIIRRVLFSNANQVYAVKYSHQKMFAASGNIAGDSASWVVWTGSNNFTDRGLKADEVTLRIADRGAYGQYVKNWLFQRNQRSSAVWAIYEEPNGGGRAPD